MTDPQRRALAYLAANDIVTPASLGQGMGGSAGRWARGLLRWGWRTTKAATGADSRLIRSARRVAKLLQHRRRVPVGLDR
jgi:hypothetical protein